MPRSSNDRVPARYVVEGTWPNAVLAQDAPVSADYGQTLAANLQQAMTTMRYTLRGLAKASGVAHATVSRVLRGEVLPDMGTIARLEAALRVQVFPRPAPRSALHGRMLLVHAELQSLATHDAARLAEAQRSVQECGRHREQALAELASARLRAEVSDRVTRGVAALIAGVTTGELPADRPCPQYRVH
ncbi:helix-turn-helix transcriptional regulator [Streptomyces sp. Edi2]|uniref:helix-turn-helix domain-containing protein n=1 Tax=Streptomyces sp. Edi2 TaxID=3162528 RepID=UPI003305C451